MGQACLDDRLARRVLAQPCGQHLAQNDLVDLLPFDTGLFQQSTDYRRPQFYRRNVIEGPAKLADSGSYRRNDDYIFHQNSPLSDLLALDIGEILSLSMQRFHGALFLFLFQSDFSDAQPLMSTNILYLI
jgi:hypothetical protein